MCPRKCGGERDGGAASGICRSPRKLKIARADLHFWEEPVISGKNGSGAIFFSGCCLECKYCQNAEISRGGRGKAVSESEFIGIMKRLEDRGAHNINLVTPTHYADAIISALSRYKPGVPVVYNCGGYEDLKVLRALFGLVDVYLPDMKYSSDILAAELSGVGDYFEVATAAISAMRAQTGETVFNGNGMLVKGTLIRHLILPGHVMNSIGVLKWIKNELPATPVSVMSQYFPAAEVDGHPELSRRITEREHIRVLEYMQKNAITNGWVQDRESASKSYVPPFSDEL